MVRRLMTIPPRDDGKARAKLNRETRLSLGLVGPIFFAESFYLARRASGHEISA